MIVQVSIRNYRTFRDRATLSFIASNYDKVRENQNIVSIEKHGLRLLKSGVIYGANASGKSKFIDALVFMKRFIINSSKESQSGEEIPIEPFLLNKTSASEPSEFEIIFLHNGIVYRYGFEVNKQQVVSEWLYYRPKTKEVELFYRDFQDFDIHSRKFSKGITLQREGLIRENALLLSVAAQFNDEIAENVIAWFKNFRTLSGLKEDKYQGFTMGRAKDPSHKKNILELLKAADLGIDDIALEMLDLNQLPANMPSEVRNFVVKKAKEENAEFVSDVRTTHKQYDDNKNIAGDIEMSLKNDESSGTIKFFALTGPILDCLENGYVLAVDELESKLHPNLVCKLVELFNSKNRNPRNAQLLFNTHDTNLLSSGMFRRDQVWFTEKNKYGEAKLYSLADFKTNEVRRDEKYEENYIRGKYGAIPYLAHFDELMSIHSATNEK